MSDDRQPFDHVSAELVAFFDAWEAGELDDIEGRPRYDERPRLSAAARAVPRAAAAVVAPPPALRASVLEAVRREAAATAAAEPASATPSATVHPLDARRRPDRSGGRWARWPLAAAAAALVLIVGLISATRSGGPSRELAFSVDLVAAPDSPSPAARGVAEVFRTGDGPVMRLEATGLAPTKPGEFYQCWFVGPGDGPETQDRFPVGTFTTAGGTITVEWSTALDPDRYPKVGITLEPDDGNPLRTGPKVMVSAAGQPAPTSP